VTVEVVFVGGQDGGRVVLVHDEGAVEEFAADAADEPSAIAFARGARTGVLITWMLVAVKTASNVVVNLASRSRIRNRKFLPASSRSRVRLRARGQPDAGRVRGDAVDADLAGGVFDDEERVEPGQGDGVDVEHVAGEDGVGLGAEELARGGPRPWR
jgi:hypothetical protein